MVDPPDIGLTTLSCYNCHTRCMPPVCHSGEYGNAIVIVAIVHDTELTPTSMLATHVWL